MKAILAIFFLLSFCSVSAQETSASGPTADVDGVREVIQNRYLAGWAASDSANLRSAFHPLADLRYVNAEGKIIVWKLNDYIAGTKLGPARAIQTHIYYIDIVGNAAQAKLHIVYNGVRFTDYMNLLKVEGRWYIASKSFMREALKN